MEFILLLLIFLFRGNILKGAKDILLEKTDYADEFLFYYSYSTNKVEHELVITKLIYHIYQFLISILFSMGLCHYLGISFQIIVLLIVMGILFLGAKFSSTMEENKARLVKDLSRFVFFYELYLIQGENQLQALNKASVFISSIDPAENVEEYFENFQKLFFYTKWLVIKRIVILLERGMHFTQKDMSMDFAQISDELFRRNYQERKLRSEKIENLMLLPMVGDLLIMVLYIVGPFLGEMIGG